jgi:hypothetical protein
LYLDIPNDFILNRRRNLQTQHRLFSLLFSLLQK